MRKQQIIAVIVVLALAGGVFAGYQFYFKPTLEKFAQDTQFLEQLEGRLDALRKTFPAGSDPKNAVQEAKNKIQPWEEALERRVKFFTIRDYRKIDPIPETKVLKAYYAQTSQKMVDDLRTEAYTKQIYLNPGINLYFGMPGPNSLSQKSVRPLEAMYWLTNIKFGTSVIRMLMNMDAAGINDIAVWTPKTDGQFTTYTIGVSMWMTMQGLCKFLERAQSDDTMFMAVQGFRIRNTQLRAFTDPYLQVDMLLRIEAYDYQAKGQAPAPGANRGAGAPAAAGLPPLTGAGSTLADQNLQALERMRQMNAANNDPNDKPRAKKSQSWLLKIWPF